MVNVLWYGISIPVTYTRSRYMVRNIYTGIEFNCTRGEHMSRNNRIAGEGVKTHRWKDEINENIAIAKGGFVIGKIFR